MWGLIGAILNGVATGMSASAPQDKSKAPPSFVGDVVIALVIALLAGGCALLAFLPDGWAARAAILLLAALLGFVAFLELQEAVRKRRRQIKATGFPVLPPSGRGTKRTKGM